MSGSRRTQRSVRLTVASTLLLFAGAVVGAAVATSTWVSGAAVFALLMGTVSGRVLYAEVVLTRRLAAIDRAAQARAFGRELASRQREHSALTQTMTARVQAQQRTIIGLEGTVRLADKRADEAESRSRRDGRRANEAQERWSSLVDEVLMRRTTTVDAGSDQAAEDQLFHSSDFSTVVDLLAWEDHAHGLPVEDLRRRQA